MLALVEEAVRGAVPILTFVAHVFLVGALTTATASATATASGGSSALNMIYLLSRSFLLQFVYFSLHRPCFPLI